MKNIDLNSIYRWPLSRQLIVFIIIFIVVFYLGYRFMLSGIFLQLEEAERQELDLKQQISLAITKENTLNQEIMQFKKFEQLLARWQAKLITEAEVPQLLNEILKIGAANQITFSLFNPSDEIVEGAYEKVVIKITAVGTYHHIANFVSQLANLNKVVAIKDFSLTNDKNVATNPSEPPKANKVLTAEMLLLIYVSMPEKKNHEPQISPKS